MEKDNALGGAFVSSVVFVGPSAIAFAGRPVD
jgi:hypothetical protein